MAQHHLPYLIRRPLCRLFSGLLIGNQIAKDPRISLGGTTDHDAIAAGFLKHPLGIFPGSHVSVSDHRNGYRLFHFADNLPVCMPGIILFPRPAVHSHCGATGVFDDFRDFYCVDMIIVKALPDFHRQRLFNSPGNFRYNLMHQFRVLHQSGALTVLHNFRHRASHIDVQKRKRKLLDPLCDFTHDIRIRSKKLQRYRRLFRMNFQKTFRIFISI